jgi:DNA repair protein RadC
MENELSLDNLLVSEIELSYKPLIKPSERPRIYTSSDAYNLFIKTWDSTKIELAEQFKVMLLNHAARVLGICTLSTGGVTGTVVDLRHLFSVALKANATQIILAHNHPSGNLKPSNHDYEVSRKITAAGELLDIGIDDHLIVSLEGFYSFAAEGIL